MKRALAAPPRRRALAAPPRRRALAASVRKRALAALACALALCAPARAEPFPSFDGFARTSRDATVLDLATREAIGRERVRVWPGEAPGRWRIAVLRELPGRFASLEEQEVRLDDAIRPLRFRYELKEGGGLARAVSVEYAEDALTVRDAEGGGEADETELDPEGDAPYVSFLIGLGLRGAVAQGRTEFEYTTVAFSPRLFVVPMRAEVEGFEDVGRPKDERRCVKLDLKPELGLIMNFIAGLVAPKTRLWFAAEPPHDFCGFEGLPLPWSAPFEIRVEPGRELGEIAAPEADFPLLDSDAWKSRR